MERTLPPGKPGLAHILVVEDDPTLLRGVKTLLRRADHEVSEAGTGREAMRLLQKRPFDVVVTDINMPEMDGIELIVELRKLGLGIPVIAMSGGGRLPKELLLENAALLGAVETIAKPFEPERLLDAVARALGVTGTQAGDVPR